MLLVTAAAPAAAQGTAAEAATLVKKAVAFAKSHGNDRLLAEVGNRNGQFVDHDLYISVWDTQAKLLAHGADPTLVGKNISNLKDVDGKPFIKEIVSKAENLGTGWVDYKWASPTTKEVMPKRAYFEILGDIIISAGYYLK
jgi:signal transduction histidine kinase